MYTTYKLSSDDSGLDCTENGLACGDLPLVAKSVATGRFEPCNPHLLQKSGITISAGGLQNVARALNENNLTTAMIAALHLMPSLGFMVKAGYRDDEARDEQGRWTAGDGDDKSIPNFNTDEQFAIGGNDDSQPSLENNGYMLIAAKTPEKSRETLEQIKAKKESFIDANLVAAQKAADQLHIPVENILGLAGFETDFGRNHFVTSGQNYFSIYAKPSDQNATQAQDSNNRLARYKDFDESVQAFVKDSDHIIYGLSDPYNFLSKLQDAGKYGINPTTGRKDPTFFTHTAKTIIGLRPLIAARKSMPL